MRYAYGQFPLDKETEKQCNFQFTGGKDTRTYRFITGFYGLTIMPTEFQKAMDKELSNLPNTYAILDVILIVTNGTKESHYQAVKQVLERIKRMNVGPKWENAQSQEKKLNG